MNQRRLLAEVIARFFDRGEYTVEFSLTRGLPASSVAAKLFPLFAGGDGASGAAMRNPFVTTDHPLVLFPLEEELLDGLAGRPPERCNPAPVE